MEAKRPIPESVTREDVLALCRLLYMLLDEFVDDDEKYQEMIDSIVEKLGVDNSA